MQENKRDFEEIVKRMNNKSVSTPPNYHNSDVEFEIGKDESSTEQKAEKIAEKIAEEAIEAPEALPEPSSEDNEEEVASIFDIAEKEENGIEAWPITTTYIPRFTGVTDKYNKKGYDDIADGEAETPLLISTDDGIDATAEIDEHEKGEAKLVNLNSEETLISDTSTLFKFDSEENAPEASKSPKAELSEEEFTEKFVENAPETKACAPDLAEAEAKEACEEVPSEKQEKAVAIDIEEPLLKKLPERYVPVTVASCENIVGVGDELSENEKSEFTESHKKDRVQDGFLDTLLSQKVRFAVALALSIALLVFENIYIFGVDLISVFHFGGMVNALAIIDIQCVFCILLLSLPELVTAIKHLRAKRVKTELYLIPAFLVYLLYSLTVIVNFPEKYSLFGSLFATLALSVIAASYFRTRADFVSFNVISAQGDKKIVDNKYTRTLDDENFSLDGIIEEYKSKTARVFKTSFVADFFRRTRRASESLPHVAAMALVPLGVSFVIAIIVYFLAPGFLSAMAAFATVYLISVPAFSVMVRKLPHYYASEEAAAEKGALIGEEAFYDYAGIDVITFDDTEIFTNEDVNIHRIRLYKSNEDLTKALRQMSALFMNVGGPLDEIFSKSLDKKCETANGIIIKENGLIGEIEGKKVMAGSYDFMISEGAEPPTDEDDGRESFDATTLMYAAENGVVYAKFYVRYRFSEEFTMLLPTLIEEKIVPLVYTRDPNLTNELMRKLTAGTSTVRILKKNTIPVRDFAPSKLSAGMVSNGDKSNLVNLLLLSRRYVKFNTRMRVSERSAMIVGLVLGALISLSGMLPLPSALLSVWQLAWCAVLSALTAGAFKLPKKTKERKKKNAKQKSLVRSKVR